MGSCTIYKNEGIQATETSQQLENIVKYIRINLGVLFEELIGDFIKDESGNWWLVNIKGYLLRPDSVPSFNFKLITNFGDEDVEPL
jgi:LMBR1 domain-containing protein 1